MLAGMASELPEALYFFDSNGLCIWANAHGIELVGITDDDYTRAESRLKEMFGEFDFKKPEWSTEKRLGTDTGNIKYYSLEKHTIPYSERRIVGSF